MIGKIENDIKLIIKQFFMNSKSLVKNKTLFFASFIFIFLALTVPVIFAPIIFSLPIVIQMATLLPLAMVFGSLAFNWRKSTLYTVSLITKTNKYNQNLATILIMIAYCFILTFFLFFFIFILAKLNLLLTNWMSYKIIPGASHQMFYLHDLKWGLIIYTQIVNVFLIFSFCFFIQRIVTDEKTFYSIILVLLILLFIFGGAFNDYFDGNTDRTNGPAWQSAMFPENMYYISLFIPMYSTGQQIGFVSNNFYKPNIDVWVWLPSIELNAWKWNILWFLPYIQMIFFCVTGIFISKLRKK